MTLTLLLLACGDAPPPAPAPEAPTTEAPAAEPAARVPGIMQDAAAIGSSANPPALRLQALVATSGANVAALLDGDPARGWRPEGDPLDEGVLLRFEAPVDLTGLSVTPCGEPWSGSGEVFVNGASVGRLAFKSGEASGWKASGEPLAARSVFIRISEGERACLGEVTLSSDTDGALNLGPPRTAEGKITASSVLDPAPAYAAHFLFDSRTDFGWVEGAEGLGVGESVTITFAEPQPVFKVELWNGYQRSPDHFAKNARAKRVSLTVDGEGPAELALADTSGPQTLTLMAPLVGSTFTLTVLEATPGSQYQDLVLSELRFWDREGPYTVGADGPTRAATAKAAAGSSLAPLLDQAYVSACSLDTGLSGRLKLRSDNSFVFYASEEIDDTDRSEVFDGAWVITEAGPVWSTVKLYGRRHTTSAEWNPYGDGDDTAEQVRVAGGAVKIAPLSALGDSEAMAALEGMDGWTACAGSVAEMQAKGAVVVQGAAISAVLFPRGG